MPESLLEQRWPWIPEWESCKPFLFTNFEKPDVVEILNQLRSVEFYTSKPKGVTWDSEEKRLLETLGKL